MDILAEIGILAEEMLDVTIETRRHLHSNPELSFEEYKTSEFIKKTVGEIGIDDIRAVAGTGLLVHIAGEKGPGKKIILRAELDALPVKEESDVSYKSKNEGVMHACGHDAHMSMMISVIKIFHRLKSRLKGDLYFLFQPGEELAPGGASLVMKENILQEIGPDAIIAQHVLPELESGKTGFRPGKYMASSDEIYIDIKGRGGHAALPGASTDQVLIASGLVVSMKSSVEPYSKDHPVVLGIGKFIAEGATNVIPGNVHIEGTLRTFDESVRSDIHLLLKRICSETETGEVKINLEIRKGYPVLTNDESLTSRAIKIVSSVNGHEKVEMLDTRMSSEDFAFYSDSIPLLFYRLGTRIPGEEIKNLHTSGFDIDESAMLTGVKTLCIIAVEMLT